jgi:uncharacterized protein (TIGR00255 family)
MPLSSMTGFARSSVEVEGAKFTWELKSVNARGLELRLRLPAGLDHLETDIRAAARERLARGSCFFTLQDESASERPRLALNEEALAVVVAAARRLATEEGVQMPTADGLLAIPGVLQEGGDPRAGAAAEQRNAALLGSFAEGIEALVAARQEEGARLAAVLHDQLAMIDRLVEEASAVAAKAPEALKARVREQVGLLTFDKSGLDPDRLHQEAVIAATRADVREELDRLRSHVAAARDLMQSDTPAGRRLEFLAQEFNREANTLCSKAFDRRLTTIGMELKAVVDQLREQVQNIV